MNKKIFVFTGANGVGTTFMTKYCAKLLANDERKIALIDGTYSRGLYYSLCINEYEKQTEALRELQEGTINPINIGNIDLYTNHPGIIAYNTFSVISSINKLLLDRYDVIFIDVDFEDAIPFCRIGDLALVVDFRRCSADNTQRSFLLPMVQELGEDNMPRTMIIYNKAIKCKMKLTHVEEYLMHVKHESKNYFLLKDIYDAEIQFLDEVYMVDLNNTFDGVLDLSKFSTDFKNSLYKIVKEFICPLNKKVKDLTKEGM